MGIRIIVYSPVKLFAEGVAKCLGDSITEFAVAWSSLDRLSELLVRERTDVLLFDVTDASGLQAARRIIVAHPTVRVLALALPEVVDRVIACAKIGFRSYVPRDASLDELCDVVVRALRGEVVCDPVVTSGLLRELRQRDEAAEPPIDGDAAVPLTPRECEVFGYLRQGLSNKEIARKLGLSAATVKNHVHNILGKTRLRNRVETRTMPRLEPWPALLATGVASKLG
ncbi:LuxR C-terminal-related transcriptional regulator [Sphingomonas sp. PAMC 26605]|uniref:LuxR C-terminal-related transcriptional regulator n=1 Tax=Sphingomonas sp. PAMC 26605 TaxID=1112214 RepID=UPI00026CCA50|nr:response regulator transcription factor [Sphingomonas sp. PAMC 26605]